MNQISTALKAAGVQLPPLNKRIWLWLNDHPGKTSKEIGLALGVAWSKSSSVLSYMHQRKMVKVVPYSVPSRYETAGRSYELLPKPKTKSVDVIAIKPPSPEVLELLSPAAAEVSRSFLRDLENYPLKELRIVRDKLNKLFETLS